MQYLLSEEEYKNLLAKAKRADEALSDEALQKFCTKAANTWPIKFWSNKNLQPWKCKITLEKSGTLEWYCDECPVQSICPHDGKSWSQ